MTAATPTPPIALTIAGSDPSGGAGIQADLKTFTALGVYGASVITALTAQNTRGVMGVHKVPAGFIAAQFDAVTSDLAVAAVKTGMLADVETVTMVAQLLKRKGLGSQALRNLVVDPVMVATSGDCLIDGTAISAVRGTLIPLADLITPNLPEAAALLETEVAKSDADMIGQARQLLQLGCRAVLLKGGHGSGGDAVDYLVTAASEHRFSRPRVATRNTHGTGCTLAAAITAGLANGLTLHDAVQHAKDFVWAALVSGAAHKIGSGAGPVNHLFNVQKRADST
ncbi:MAG: bifunctional hydroxymethylpyrimidine kinase/phosphomethylpyrimidine kinase [Hyphomicrobium sp.]|nr:bifunctional hydroxymethylpyrimidine kinase/phosphomethylpyrimidine kinase [Hyphomicrobium sp.]